MAENIQRPIRNNNREIIGYEEFEVIPANNDREDGILFNTIEVPVLRTDATEEEEAVADEEAKKLLEESKNSSPSDEEPVL